MYVLILAVSAKARKIVEKPICYAGHCFFAPSYSTIADTFFDIKLFFESRNLSIGYIKLSMLSLKLYWRQICLQFGCANKIALYRLTLLDKYPQHTINYRISYFFY